MISASVKNNHIHSWLRRLEPLELVRDINEFASLVREYIVHPNLTCVALKIETDDLDGIYAPNTGKILIDLYDDIQRENRERGKKDVDGPIDLLVDCSRDVREYINVQLTMEHSEPSIDFRSYLWHIPKCNAIYESRFKRYPENDRTAKNLQNRERD